jgi:hypothetical protein
MPQSPSIDFSQISFLDDSPCLDGYDDGTEDLKCVWNFTASGYDGELIYRLPEKQFDACIIAHGKIKALSKEIADTISASLPEPHRLLINAWNDALESGNISDAASIDLSTIQTTANTL